MEGILESLKKKAKFENHYMDDVNLTVHKIGKALMIETKSLLHALLSKEVSLSVSKWKNRGK